MAAEALAVENARRLAATPVATTAFLVDPKFILSSLISPSSFAALLFTLPQNGKRQQTSLRFNGTTLKRARLTG
jgi:hypothetical protein